MNRLHLVLVINLCIYFQLTVLANWNFLYATGDIFWNNLSDQDILKAISIAEEELKIYIYPIPLSAQLKESKFHLLSHFHLEYVAVYEL